jgi:zinc and cadmium transporter
MTPFLWIFFGGISMSAIALVGSLTLVFREVTLRKLLLPLVALAAGNFIYIAAADLIPEIKHEESARLNVIHFLSFLTGMALLLAIRLVFER